MRKNYRSRMSDEGLIAHTRKHLRQEAQLDLQVLDDLREIHARKLYLAYGFPNFHKFCTDELGMSDDSAWRRLKAASLADRFPDVVRPLIAEGKVHLTGLALLNRVITPENGARLIREAAGKSTTDVKSIVAREAPQEFASGVRKLPVKQMAADSWRFTGNLNSDGKALLEECQDLAGTKDEDTILVAALEAYRDELRARKQKALRRRPLLNAFEARRPHLAMPAMAGAAAFVSTRPKRVTRTIAEPNPALGNDAAVRTAAAAASPLRRGERAALPAGRPAPQNDAAPMRRDGDDWSETLAGSPPEKAEPASDVSGSTRVVVVRSHLRRQPSFAFEARSAYRLRSSRLQRSADGAGSSSPSLYPTASMRRPDDGAVASDRAPQRSVITAIAERRRP